MAALYPLQLHKTPEGNLMRPFLLALGALTSLAATCPAMAFDASSSTTIDSTSPTSGTAVNPPLVLPDPNAASPLYYNPDPRTRGLTSSDQGDEDRIRMSGPLDTGPVTIRQDESGTATDTSRFGDPGLSQSSVDRK